MSNKLKHGDSLYQVIEKVNELIDGKVQPGSGGSGGSSGGGGSAAINGVQDMIYAEIERAQAAEQYLQEQIDAIVNPESGNNSGAIPDVGSVQPALIIESLRATTAEQALQINISNEVTRATTAEQNLHDQIDAITPIKETYSATLNGEKGSTWIINATRYNGIITIGIDYQLGPDQTTDTGETISSTDTLPAKWRPCIDMHVIAVTFVNQTQHMFRLLINTNGQLQIVNSSSGTTSTLGRIYGSFTYIAGDLIQG